ncbi:nicotinamidase [Tolumonas lignilytica]|jgi:Amidases related to nicotinamidase|uniref:nicotinamidase n=1 Tax=Tolumonas lignilytica TaxID=1283284 RepID=UPI000467EB43|nr:nicotinamidase [Tolumonas lignilytica]
MKIAAIDVDVQNTFTPLCPDELPVPEGHLIAQALNAQAGLADYRIMTKDAHTPLAPWVVPSHAEMFQPVGLPEADVTWVAHAVPGSHGFNLIEGLPAVTDYDFLVYKGVEPTLHPYGACYHDLSEKLSTGLIEWLNQHQVSSVIVGGLALDYCVKTTALQLKKAGFNVLVNLSASRGIADDTIQEAIEQMRQSGILLPGDLNELKWLLNT